MKKNIYILPAFYLTLNLFETIKPDRRIDTYKYS